MKATAGQTIAYMYGMYPTEEELAKKRKYRIQKLVEQIIFENRRISKYSCYTGRFILYYEKIWIEIKSFLRCLVGYKTFYGKLEQFISMIFLICYNIVFSILGIVTKIDKDLLKFFKVEKAQNLKKLEDLLTYSKDQTAEEFQEQNKRDDAIGANRMPLFEDYNEDICEVYIKCQEKNLVTLCELGLEKYKNYLKRR